MRAADNGGGSRGRQPNGSDTRINAAVETREAVTDNAGARLGMILIGTKDNAAVERGVQAVKAAKASTRPLIQ
jgi:hypothetical protein